LYKQNRQKAVVNGKLSEQNAVILEKKREIDKSINYAKGIQNSILPDLKEVSKYLKNCFIYYLPKDVVSGDFYWFHEHKGFFYLMVGDCTGHGVPGALMSIVSMDRISQAIFEKGFLEPKDILSSLNIEIKKALKQQAEDAKQKDGLDIAILRFDHNSERVVYAGANRPLVLIRKGVLEEIKPDKMAIAGFTPDNFEFNQREIQVKKGDCLYIFSDGYADQFGGPEGKKFMIRNFKLLLESISGEEISLQEKDISKSHQDWKGNYEQVDDILVIGVKI
jgi:serine phosphatase RsbU (regulator of sigma subunit)